ncbi:MAG: cupin domain-containing protein [Cyanobacteria bacterium P01_H01_bin.15]
MDKAAWIERLALQRHPEGGYYSEIYRSEVAISTQREGRERSLLTSIYFLLTDDSPVDHFHLNQSDILHYFHAGSPVTYLVIDPVGSLQEFTLGLDLAKGEVPQLLVPGGYWKAAVLKEGSFGLLGEAVAPGFDFRDMQLATADDFQAKFPELWSQVEPYVHAAV